jgi:hypothetical protein
MEETPLSSPQQLVEFLAAVSYYEDKATVLRGAVELASEAMESEVGAIVHGDEVLAVVGFAADSDPSAALLEVVANRASTLQIPGAGTCTVVAVPLEAGDSDMVFLLARPGPEFTWEEVALLQAMARVVALTLGSIKENRVNG